MLVLSRRKDECIHIGTREMGIRIMVVEIRQDCVKLGIDAPDLPIYRQEILETIEREKELKGVSDASK